MGRVKRSGSVEKLPKGVERSAYLPRRWRRPVGASSLSASGQANIAERVCRTCSGIGRQAHRRRL